MNFGRKFLFCIICILMVREIVIKLGNLYVIKEMLDFVDFKNI